jgi:hypothetical protein
MDLNLRLIHANDFLKTRPSGEYDLEMTKRLLLELARENSSPIKYDILIDVRAATGNLTLIDITELVQVMIENRDSFRSKLVVLTSHGRQFDNARFMALYAGNRGFQVGAFNEFEEAISWLMISAEAPDAAQRHA